MRAKPKAASWWNLNKKLVVVISISVLAVVLLSFLFYQSQRPNYRDLEKEFSKLQIPSGWVQTNQSSTMGFMGVICLAAVSDQACPSISRIYQHGLVVSPDEDKALLEEIANMIGGKIVESNFASCTQGADTYFCSVSIESSSNITANIGIDKSTGKKILNIYTD